MSLTLGETRAVAITGIFVAGAARELEAVLKVLPRGDDSARTRHYLNLITAGRQGLKGTSSTRASVP